MLLRPDADEHRLTERVHEAGLDVRLRPDGAADVEHLDRDVVAGLGQCADHGDEKPVAGHAEERALVDRVGEVGIARGGVDGDAQRAVLPLVGAVAVVTGREELDLLAAGQRHPWRRRCLVEAGPERAVSRQVQAVDGGLRRVDLHDEGGAGQRGGASRAAQEHIAAERVVGLPADPACGGELGVGTLGAGRGRGVAGGGIGAGDVLAGVGPGVAVLVGIAGADARVGVRVHDLGQGVADGEDDELLQVGDVERAVAGDVRVGEVGREASRRVRRVRHGEHGALHVGDVAAAVQVQITG